MYLSRRFSHRIRRTPRSRSSRPIQRHYTIFGLQLPGLIGRGSIGVINIAENAARQRRKGSASTLQHLGSRVSLIQLLRLAASKKHHPNPTLYTDAETWSSNTLQSGGLTPLSQSRSRASRKSLKGKSVHVVTSTGRTSPLPQRTGIRPCVSISITLLSASASDHGSIVHMCAAVCKCCMIMI